MISRILRVLVGLGLIGYGVYSANAWFYLGVLPLLTALINWCPFESKVGGCDPSSGCCSSEEPQTQNPKKKESVITGISKPSVPNFTGSSFSAQKPRKIEILGTGCAKCIALAKTVQEVVDTLDGNFEVVKVENIEEIMAYQVMSTPGLVIDGEVKSTGKLLSQTQVRELLV
ncbi:redox-active disulfide protein 2 [hydrothermal vent metagenome]|uniref:Redox-active disulfide protein 2 n=1 Tax=hydrothermal vent metagenome TaxID=652676 RepID=A0A1W1C6T9_9ZZZZ